MALNFDKFAMEGNSFIKEMAISLGHPEDTERAGRVLRSVLHALRDQLTPEESVQLISQLPMFLKAVYVHNWRIGKRKERIHHFDEFILEICRIHGNIAERDLPTDDDVERAISVVFRLLHKYVSLGEMEDIKAVLPKELKIILNDVLMI